MSNLLSDFKKFIMQGDLVSLAVAIIIGLAFKTLVDSLVNDVIMPFVGAIFGKPSFGALTLKIGDGVIHYGSFVNAIINFLIIAATVFPGRARLRSLQGEAQRRGEGSGPD